MGGARPPIHDTPQVDTGGSHGRHDLGPRAEVGSGGDTDWGWVDPPCPRPLTSPPAARPQTKAQASNGRSSPTTSCEQNAKKMYPAPLAYIVDRCSQWRWLGPGEEAALGKSRTASGRRSTGGGGGLREEVYAGGALPEGGDGHHRQWGQWETPPMFSYIKGFRFPLKKERSHAFYKSY